MNSSNNFVESPQNLDILLETIKKELNIKDKRDLLIHLLDESGHVYENNILKKRDLVQRYEKLIRMQHLQLQNLNDAVMELRFQNEQLLLCISNYHDSLSKILTSTRGNHPMEESQTKIGDTYRGNKYSFDPSVARSALINSRTKSAPQIEIDNDYPIGLKINSGYPMFSTSTTSLNISKEHLKYPLLAPNFPIISSPISINNINITSQQKPKQEEKNLSSKFKVKLLTKESIQEEKNDNKKRKRVD